MKLRKNLTAMVVIFAAVAGPLRAESLADALVYAYEDSGLVDQNRALLRAADEDVAQAVAFLAGNGGAYITGQELHVNGGMYMA